MTLLTLAVLVGLLQQPALPKLDRTIEVPMDFDGTAIFLKGKINDKPASFFFDTGFSGSVLISDRLKVGPKEGTMILRDFVGTREADTVVVKSFSVGDLELATKEIEIPQIELADLTAAYGRHCDAMLGFEPFYGHVMEFNFENSKLIFHPWDKVDITKRTPDGQRTFLVEMLPYGVDVPNIGVRFADETMDLVFDTGNSSYVVTYGEHLKEMGLYKEKKPDYIYKSMIATGPTDSFDWWAHGFSIGGIHVDHAVFTVLQLPSSQVESGGTIGIGFIKQFNVTVDARRRALWFERIGDAAFKPPPAETGIKAAFDDKIGRWVVWYVQPGSPAKKAGVETEDTILRVDGVDVRNMTRGQFEELLGGDAGSIAEIRVSRRGSVKSFKVERRHLVNGDAPEGL
jgi:hypothetical protein